MNDHITATKIIGSPSLSGWSQCHDYTPGDPKVQKVKGRLIVCVSSRQTPPEDAKDVLHRIYKSYYGGQGSTSTSLSDAVAGVEDSVSVAACVCKDGTLTAVARGIAVLLVRGGNVVPLLAGHDVKNVSGPIHDGDVIILATSKFISEFTLPYIKGQLEYQQSDRIADVFLPRVQAHDDSGLIAAQFLFFKKPHVPEWEHKDATPHVPHLGLRKPQFAIKVPHKALFVGKDKTALPEPFEKQKKKVSPLVGIGLIAVLLVSIVLGIARNKEQERKSQYEPLILEIEQEISEAQTLADISPTKAQEMILSAKGKVMSLKERNVDDPRIEPLVQKVREALGTIAGIYESSASQYLDISLIASNFTGDELSYSDGEILVADYDTKRIAKVILADKNTKIIAGPDYFVDLLSTAAYAGRSFALSTDGIREVTGTVSLVIKSDWNPEQILYAVYAGNAYIVDKEASVIYRYPGVRGGFLEKEEWLAPGITAELRDAKAMAIDGSIWILQGGDLLRFTNGIPQRFNLEGTPTSVDQFDAFFTDEATTSLYLLDRETAAIYAYTKTGEFEAQYGDAKIGSASHLVVSEKDGKIIFLADGKLWQVEIKK